jgi:TM2 domain-containing membrane protein YozV
MSSTDCADQAPKLRKPFKDPLVTLGLSIIPGLIGLFGIGHFYVGRPLRGISFLVVGGIAAFLLIFHQYPLLSGLVNSVVASFLIVFLIVMLIASVADALLLARAYNREGQATGIALW